MPVQLDYGPDCCMSISEHFAMDHPYEYACQSRDEWREKLNWALYERERSVSPKRRAEFNMIVRRYRLDLIDLYRMIAQSVG